MRDFLPDTLPHALRLAVQRGPDTCFLIDGDRHFSYTHFDARTDRLAQGLRAMGLGAGDRIGLLMLNQVEWVELFFAAMKLGAVVVGMSLRYRDHELEYMVNDAGVKAIFMLSTHEGHDFREMFVRLAPKMPSVQHLVCVDPVGPRGSAMIDALMDRAAPGDEAPTPGVPSPDQLAMIIYTSGTTGRPKGAGLTHHSLLASARAQTAHTGAGPGDLIQLPTPLNHVGGITCGILAMMLGGGTLDLVAEFKVPLLLSRMKRHPPTFLGGVPTMMTLLLMHSEGSGVDFSGIRIITVGGSNVDATLAQQLRARMPGAQLMNLYGLSESSGALVMSPADCAEEDLLHTIGRPLQGVEVRVVDRERRVLATGEIGELCFRGAGVIPGYVGAAAGNDAFSADGWLFTGDLGQVDARGFITLKGRAKDMYIQGGFNVYPAEIEAYIAQHPAVAMVAGIGVPDPVLGEIGRYYLVLKPGAELDAATLRAWCAQGLADYKVPRQFVFRDSLPLTPVGKIHKAALRAE